MSNCNIFLMKLFFLLPIKLEKKKKLRVFIYNHCIVFIKIL